MLTKLFLWLTSHPSVVVVAALGALLTAAYVTVVYRTPESIPVKEIVVNEVPVCQPTGPTTVCPVTPTKVSKPIIYVSKDNNSFGFNEASEKLLADGHHVIHIQYDKGYDVMDLRVGSVHVERVDWPASWCATDKIAIGIYNTATGRYAVSTHLHPEMHVLKTWGC